MLVDINKFPYEIKIPFRYGDTINKWDKICADCVETYGLPGDKYITSPTADYMCFYFKHQEDALWFSLASE